jgi:hypothetical protein
LLLDSDVLYVVFYLWCGVGFRGRVESTGGLVVGWGGFVGLVKGIVFYLLSVLFVGCFFACLVFFFDGTIEAPRWLVLSRFRRRERTKHLFEHHPPVAHQAADGNVGSSTNILQKEEKAMRNGKKGCLDAILIDEAIA